jgi:diguanylate cyclase (GGDEF)-like protein
MEHGTSLALIMIDIDHFKQFNDTYGHDVGDQVLRMVASRLARAGGGGRAYRLGGEEFVVLFAGKSVEECEPHLEALRESVADAKFKLRAPGRPKHKPQPPRPATTKPRHLAVTVSIGAAQSRRTATPDDVVKAADKMLYRAKDGGRNRVET